MAMWLLYLVRSQEKPVLTFYGYLSLIRPILNYITGVGDDIKKGYSFDVVGTKLSYLGHPIAETLKRLGLSVATVWKVWFAISFRDQVRVHVTLPLGI